MNTQPNIATTKPESVLEPDKALDEGESLEGVIRNPFGSVWTSPRFFGLDGNEYLFQRILRWIPGVRMNLNCGTTYITNLVTAHPHRTAYDRANFKRVFIGARGIKERSLIFVENVNNPGVEGALRYDMWKKHPGPFLLFFSPVTFTPAERIEEVNYFAGVLAEWIEYKKIDFPVGILLNTVIPTDDQSSLLFDMSVEVTRWLDILGKLEIPIFLRFEVTTDPSTASVVSSHKSCLGISVASSIRWGCKPSSSKQEGIPWDDIFGKRNGYRKIASPPYEDRYGHAYYSGRYMLPLIKSWICDFKCLLDPWRKGHRLHINAGGVMSAHDAIEMYLVGVNSITIAPAAQISPANMMSLIKQAQVLFPSDDDVTQEL